MKKLLYLILFIVSNRAIAQNGGDSAIKIDLLRAPASPASNLLGIATSDVDKPTDVSALMLSLQSATSSFNKFPSNYAVDIAPYWLFKSGNKGDITTKGFRKPSGKEVFKQTLTLSFAIKNPDSSEAVLNQKSTYGGFGFKFYVLRGDYDEETNKSLDAIKSLQRLKLQKLDSIITMYKESQDPEVTALRVMRKSIFIGFDPNDASNANKRLFATLKAQRDAIDSALSAKLLHSSLDSSAATEKLDKEIQQIAASFQAVRVGWTWDINGGVSAEFRSKRFDNSKMYNAGLWTTLGYTDANYGAGLFLLRLLHNPDKIFAKGNMANTMGDITTLDAGLRYIYAKSQSKFSTSIEAIYRSILSSNTIKPSWRLVYNADYAIWQNQKLTFSFGKSFDGTITKDGNLIAALSFLTGFGNKRAF